MASYNFFRQQQNKTERTSAKQNSFKKKEEQDTQQNRVLEEAKNCYQLLERVEQMQNQNQNQIPEGKRSSINQARQLLNNIIETTNIPENKFTETEQDKLGKSDQSVAEKTKDHKLGM